MPDFLELSPTPTEEPCAQAGTPDYADRAYKECAAFRDQLYRKFPKGIFRAKRFQHDFGSYFDVVAVLGHGAESDQAGWEAEGDLPEYWDAEAREWLKKQGVL